jgi:hypothetical protein
MAVSDLIDALVAHRDEPCPEPPNPDGSPGPKRKEWLAKETALEEPLALAIAHHYGPVVWLGRLWWTYLPPRGNTVNHFPVRNAADCPWPPEPVVGRIGPRGAVGPMPEKVAGYIPRNEVEQS